MIEQNLAAGDFHHQILRHQRDIAGVDIFAQFPLGQPESGVADTDDVFLGQRR
jgi:hypothetical protein